MELWCYESQSKKQQGRIDTRYLCIEPRTILHGIFGKGFKRPNTLYNLGVFCALVVVSKVVFKTYIL